MVHRRLWSTCREDGPLQFEVNRTSRKNYSDQLNEYLPANQSSAPALTSHHVATRSESYPQTTYLRIWHDPSR